MFDNMSKLVDLTGQIFNRWTVIKNAHKDRWGHTMWLCNCECGTERAVVGHQLKNGVSKSCGCLHKE